MLRALPVAGSRRWSGGERGGGRTGAAGEARSLAVPHRPPRRRRGPGPCGEAPPLPPHSGSTGPPGLTPRPPLRGVSSFSAAPAPDGGPPRTPTPVRRGPGPAEERSRPAVPPREGRALPSPVIPPPRLPRVLKWRSTPSPYAPLPCSLSPPAAPARVVAAPPAWPGLCGDPAPGPRLTPPLPGTRQLCSRRTGPPPPAALTCAGLTSPGRGQRYPLRDAAAFAAPRPRQAGCRLPAARGAAGMS